MSGDILKMIYDVAQSRKSGDPAQSYVAKLFSKGEDTILKKIGEEAAETIIAHKTADRRQIVYETADLWFHSIVALAHKDIPVGEVLEELERRYGKTGLRAEE